jgi:hypothetical protein
VVLGWQSSDGDAFVFRRDLTLLNADIHERRDRAVWARSNIE